ncbi:hypothetical protein SIXOD_v1c19500 [Spiroplasma ixodetis Y32]|nr:hypothetical protein SIXOD_v1c19500 [Spiroplasma ixodetis Y32]
MPNIENTQLNNYTLIKLIRTGISPLSAMIGTSAYLWSINWKSYIR